MSDNTSNNSSNITSSLASSVENSKNHTKTDAACAMAQKPTGCPMGEEESAYMRLWNYEVYKKAYEDASATTSTAAAADNSSNKETNVDVAVLQTLYEELQSLTAPQDAHERLSAGGKETNAAEKFCCCPTAQCYVCQNGISGVARVSSPAPTSYWRVPNQCPCFDAQNRNGELRGTATNAANAQNRTSGGCGTIAQRVDVQQRNICPNTLQPLGKLYLPLPSIKYCQKKYNSTKFNPKFLKLKASKKQLVSNNQPTTLGKTVGLIKSSEIVKSNNEAQQKERFATYLQAIALLYFKEATQWRSTDLDLLIVAGKTLIDEEKKPNEETRTEVYNLVEESVPRTFLFGEYNCHIELEPGNWIWTLSGNLYDNLNYFFKKHDASTYCLLQLRHWYVLIWRARGGAYFVLDMNGRSTKTLEYVANVQTEKMKKIVETEEMFAVLLCLRKLINVVQLLVNMSNLEADEPFLIREIFMAQLTTPDGKRMARNYGQRYPEYIIVNASYAYLRTNLHLTLNKAETTRNRSALPVALAAMIAAKIDHPATWNIKTLDQLICFGVNVCRLCWKPCVDLKKPINLNTFPRCLHMGQFLINYELKPEAYTGIWICNATRKNLEFHSALQHAFKTSMNLLLQIEHQMYALWCKQNFYYLLDPYLHTVWGDYNATKTATLRLFNNFDSLVYILQDILMQSTHTTKFYIHTLKIQKIQNCGECKKGFTKTIHNENIDVLSLNENIDFAEDFTDCMYELGKTSNYEFDLSAVSTLKSITTSVTYIHEEEGEEMANKAGMGNFDFSELESSSSGQKRKHAKTTTKNRTKNTLNNLNKTEHKRKHSKQKYKQNITGKLNNKKTMAIKLDPMQNTSNTNSIDTMSIYSIITVEDVPKLPNFKQTEAEKTQPVVPVVANRNNRINNQQKHVIQKKKRTYNPAMQKQFLESTKKQTTPINPTHEKKSNALIASNVSSNSICADKLKLSNLVCAISSQLFSKTTSVTNSDVIARIHMPRESLIKQYQAKIAKQYKTVRTNLIAKKLARKWIEATRSRIARYGGAFASGICCQPLLRRLYGNLNKSGSNIQFEISKDFVKAEKVPDIERDIQALQRNTPRLTEKMKNIFIAPVEKPDYTKVYAAIRRGFKHTDRVLIRTNWGNFVIFCGAAHMKDFYYLYDGCTCCTERFKYLDLSSGTAGLLPFCSLNDVVCYIIDTHDLRQFSSKEKINIFQNGCQQCNKNLCSAK